MPRTALRATVDENGMTMKFHRSFVMAGLVPAIHVVGLRTVPGFGTDPATWMAGTSPAMTNVALF